jgi:molybdate transport system substrate-binding protein
VTFSFAGSSDLVTQLQGGAPADVFASADSSNMTKASNDGLVAGAPVTFATNTLEIVVPRGNPAQVSSFADLAKPGLKLVTCAAQVPCGAAAHRIETATGVALSPVSEESSVTDVLNKVQTGEADAGLVYVTDVRAAGDRVTGVPFGEAKRAVNRYPIAVLAASKHPDLAGEFVALVTGAQGRRVLSAAGFGS